MILGKVEYYGSTRTDAFQHRGTVVQASITVGSLNRGGKGQGTGNEGGEKLHGWLWLGEYWICL